MTRPLRIVLACAIALLVIGTGGFAALMLIPSAPQTTSSMVGALGGPFTLTATDGRAVTDQTYRGKWVLIYFGYTSCPDACPTALNNMGIALDRLGPEAAHLQPIFITVDPKRDNRDTLSEYLKSFDPRIVALTGTDEQVAEVVKEYHVYVEVPAGSGGDYLVNHSSFYYLINPEGQFVRVIAGDVSGEELAERLRHWMSKTV
jgi:cytochrome oxidase Cu insertion factor (SCO1/SenC/PrrC family)